MDIHGNVSRRQLTLVIVVVILLPIGFGIDAAIKYSANDPQWISNAVLAGVLVVGELVGLPFLIRWIRKEKED